LKPFSASHVLRWEQWPNVGRRATHENGVRADMHKKPFDSSHLTNGDGKLARDAAKRPRIGSDGEENHRRVESAKAAIEQMAYDAIEAEHSGTIGVEIPMKDGKLGKLKRIKIFYQKS
jgi:hypothetical protein